MPAVWDRIIRISARYIKFSYNAVEQANIKAQFEARAGFPNVIGAIDCTNIAIKAPSHDEFVYVKRKHFHSINVQIICDAQMQLTNIVARCPGSTHNSYILSIITSRWLKLVTCCFLMVKLQLKIFLTSPWLSLCANVCLPVQTGWAPLLLSPHLFWQHFGRWAAIICFTSTLISDHFFFTSACVRFSDPTALIASHTLSHPLLLRLLLIVRKIVKLYYVKKQYYVMGGGFLLSFSSHNIGKLVRLFLKSTSHNIGNMNSLNSDIIIFWTQTTLGQLPNRLCGFVSLLQE